VFVQLEPLLIWRCVPSLQARHQASNVDAHSAQSTDEAFLSKESSQEELDERLDSEDRELQDSEEYI
jgi:hypothetical protein